MLSPVSITALALAITSLSSSAVAHPGHPSSSSAKKCYEYKIKVDVESENYSWGLPIFENNYDVVDVVTAIGSRNAAEFNPFGGSVNATGSYITAATFCTPTSSKAGKKDTVLLATHGLNFDRNYWNPSFEPEKYNFVDHAIREGYSFFFYDRLGVGESSRISGYVNQASIQLAILQRLTELVRLGHYTANIGKPKAIILVGHSYGSALSAAAITAAPTIAEGVILTGFSYNGSNAVGFTQAAGLRIAKDQSHKFRSFDSGYLTPVDKYANANTFFKAPDYDTSVVKWADEHKAPFAISELLTSMQLPVTPFKYTGVAMVIAGQFDLIFCQSQCDDIIEHPAKEIFGMAKAFKAVSFPGAGHGLNFAKNASASFSIITDFLATNGL